MNDADKGTERKANADSTQDENEAVYFEDKVTKQINEILKRESPFGERKTH